MTEVVTAVSQAAGADAREVHPGFGVYDSEFAAALGPAPRLALVAETDAHEGPVYVPGEDALYFTTLPQTRNTPTPGTPRAVIKRLALDGLSFPVDPQRLSVLPAPVHIMAVDVQGGSHLGPGRLFAVTTPGFPDGIKADLAGRVYASSFSGVQVFSPAGDLIGQIRLPGAVNFTFGGPGGEVLFITTDTAIWAAVLNPAAGVRPRRDQEPWR